MRTRAHTRIKVGKRAHACAFLIRPFDSLYLLFSKKSNKKGLTNTILSFIIDLLRMKCVYLVRENRTRQLNRRLQTVSKVLAPLEIPFLHINGIDRDTQSATAYQNAKKLVAGELVKINNQVTGSHGRRFKVSRRR